MNRIQTLIDERRALEALLYGKNMEIAMELGEREDAEHWQRLMYAAATARRAVREVQETAA